MVPRSRYFSIILTLCMASILYVNINNYFITYPDSHVKISGYKSNDTLKNIRKIVGYSLLKDIELRNEEYLCEGGVIKVNNNAAAFVDEGRDFTEEIKSGLNNLWTKIEGTFVFVYSVHVDTRLSPFNYVRIIAMIKDSWTEKLFCQSNISGGRYYITKADIRKIWSENWETDDRTSYYNPVLISCNLPLNQTIKFISISKTPCTISSKKFMLKYPEAKHKNTFTLCVKPLNFDKDISSRLVQWLEINSVLGADIFEIYIGNVPGKVTRFLNWYNSTVGAIKLIQHVDIEEGTIPSVHTSTGNKSNDVIKRYIWQKRRYEIIIYNDCFYRNLYRTEFVIPIDIDEIIVPRRVYTWKELLNRTLSLQLRETYASFTVQNAYYLHSFTDKHLAEEERVFYFRDFVRSDLSVKGESGKSFISTKNALTVFNHYSLEVLKPGIRKYYFLSPYFVQMNHYKETCSVVVLPECDKYLSSPVRIVDSVMFKYKEEVYRRLSKFFNVFINMSVV